MNSSAPAASVTHLVLIPSYNPGPKVFETVVPRNIRLAEAPSFGKPIILYASHSDFQQTNALYGGIDESTGGVTESAKSRMILPFTGSYADFDHVMTHELVHGFQYDVMFRRGPIAELARRPAHPRPRPPPNGHGRPRAGR